MPLHVARLRDSDLASEEKPEACWYAVLLWAAAWHQLPAGSLPDNDAVLTKLIGLGRDVRTFLKHKAGAMRGFVKCSDGRLYHPVVAEQVISAWTGKLQQRWRTECARIKKANQRNETDLPAPSFEQFCAGMSLGTVAAVPGDTNESPEGQGVQEKGTGTGTEEKKDADASPVGPDVPTGELSLLAEEPAQLSQKRRPWESDPGFGAVWDAATPQMRSRAKSREKVWPEWTKAKRASAADRILAGLLAYLGSDPDVGRTGGPGLHIWLRDRTFELWVGEFAVKEAPAAAWPGPPDLLAAIIAETDAGFAQSYVVPSGWRNGPERVIVCRNEFAAEKLRTKASGALERFKVRAIVGTTDPADLLPFPKGRSAA